MIFDAHTHLPSEGWPGHKTWFAGVAEVVRYLQDAGTDAALFNTWQGVFAVTEQDLEQGNAAALELAERYPGFLFPGACIHPAFPEASRKWLARFRARGYFWVGELVHYKTPYKYCDAPFMDLAAECAARGHVLQLHCHADIVTVARSLPGLPVVCSHIDLDLCRQLAPLPNAWVDLSGSAGGLSIGSIETACQTLGPERLLFGTDFTGYEPRAFQTRLRMAVPDPRQREQIFFGNLLRLLETVGSRRPQRSAP